MSTVLTEGRHTGEFLLSEGPGSISRDGAQLGSGTAGLVKDGTVLGQITATKLYVPHDPAASDGSQTAAAILLGNAFRSASAAIDIVVISRLAEIKKVCLTLNAATDTDAEKATVYAALAVNHVIAR